MTHTEPASDTPMPPPQKDAQMPHNLPPEEDASLSMSALGKGSLMVLFAQGLQSIRGIVLLPFITRMLSAGDYGLWVQAGTLTSVLAPIASLYLGSAMLRFFAANASPRHAARTLAAMFIAVSALGLLVTSAAVLASNSLASAFFEGQRTVVLLALLSLLPECLGSLCLAYFRAFRQMGRFSFFSVARPYLELIVVIWLLFTGHPLTDLLVGMALVRTALVGVMGTIILREAGRAAPDFSPLPQYLRYSVPHIPTNLLLWITNASDRFVIGYYLGAAAVGFYNPGYALGGLVAALSAPIMHVLPPFVYAHYDRGRPHLAMRYLSNIIFLVTIAGLFTAASLGGLSFQILSLLSTTEIAREGFFVTPIVALGITSQTCTVVISIALGCVKKTYLMALSALAGAGLNLGLNIIFIPQYGIIAAAATTLVAMLIDFSIRLAMARRYVQLPLPWWQLTRAALAALLLGIGLSILSPTTTAPLVALLALSPLVYLGLLLGLRVIRARDLAATWRFVVGLLPRGR